MPLEKWTFDKQSARRIGRATLEVEHMRRGKYPRGSRHRDFEDVSYWDMFEFEYDGTTSIKVHAGYWIRWANGHDHWVPLTTDSGTSGDPDDYYTLTGITSTKLILAKLSKAASSSSNEANALDPDTLEITTAASIPVDDDYFEYFPLGVVTASGGVITNVRNYHTGVIGNYMAILDGNSLNYGEDRTEQIYDWDVAASGGSMPTDALIPYHNDINDDLLYADQSDFGDWIAEYFNNGGTWPYQEWSELLDTVGDPEVSWNEGYIPVVTHQGDSTFKLELIDPDLMGNWWKLDGNYDEAYGPEIGNSGGADKVIDLDAEQLFPAGYAWTLDWDARQFDGDDWTFLAGTVAKVADTTAATANDTGALQVKGGINAQDTCYFDDGTYVVELLSSGESSAGYFYESPFQVYICGQGSGLFAWDGDYGVRLANQVEAGNFQSSTETVRLATASYGVDVTDGVGINVHSGGDYYHNDVQGATQTDPALTILDVNGGAHTLYLRGGILCAS